MSTATISQQAWIPNDDAWSAAGGTRASHSRKETRSSSRTATRDAANWLRLNQNASPEKIYAVTSWTELETSSTPIGKSDLRVSDTPQAQSSTPSRSSGRKSFLTNEPSGISPRRDIPFNYVQKIKECFGTDVDLYRDVLKVPREASPREMRIAYFRRGREVLSEGNFIRPKGNASSVGHAVSNDCKQRFQAVSMAYEIVQNPAWIDVYESGASEPITTPVLRRPRSTSLGRRRSRSQNAVRWKEEVEELVFEQHPTEKSAADSKRRSKRNKKKIVVDATVLESHLEKLDREAEKHYGFDFLDNIEASIEEMLSLASSRSGGSRSSNESECRTGNSKSTEESRSRTGNSKSSKESRARTGNSKLSKEMASMKSINHLTRAVPSRKVDDEARNKTPRPASESDLPVSKLLFEFDTPTNIVVSKEANTCSNESSSVQTNDDTLSTLSFSVGDQRNVNDVPTRSTSHQMEGFEEEERNVLSDDVAFENALQQKDESWLEADELDLGCGSWCSPDEQDRSEDGLIEGILMQGKAHNSTHEAKDQDSQFHLFLLSYLQSLAEHAYSWGSALPEVDVAGKAQSLLEAMTLSESDLEGMLGILRNDMDGS